MHINPLNRRNAILLTGSGLFGVTQASLAQAPTRTASRDLSRLDRYEPQINGVTGQDVRDTTTPTAMARTTAHLLTSDWLSTASRETLIAWMVATTTGNLRLRAGLPDDWRTGDKTGTGGVPNQHDKYNDIAITWPPSKAPLVITAFYETPRSHSSMRDKDQAVLAQVGRIAAAWHAAS